MRFPLARALDALERGGCRVDRVAQVARLPEDVVRAALRAAPKAPLLAARDPRCDLVLDGRRCYLSNDGCGVWVIDPESGRAAAEHEGGTWPTRRASWTPCPR